MAASLTPSQRHSVFYHYLGFQICDMLQELLKLLKLKGTPYICCHWLLFVVPSLSHLQLFIIPWTAVYHAFLPLTISRSLFKLKSTGSVMPSKYLVFHHPLLLLQSLAASESLPMSWLFTSDNHNIGASASASAPPVNFQD